MPVLIYYVGGPLDGEHQTREAINDTPGSTETITILPFNYLDPTGADYRPGGNTQATYGLTGMVSAPLLYFNHHTPAQLPVNGYFPANWDSNGVPPAAIQMVPGGTTVYSIDSTQWIYTGTGWILAPPVDITTDEEYVFTYVPPVQI